MTAIIYYFGRMRWVETETMGPDRECWKPWRLLEWMRLSSSMTVSTHLTFQLGPLCINEAEIGVGHLEKDLGEVGESSRNGGTSIYSSGAADRLRLIFRFWREPDATFEYYDQFAAYGAGRS